MGAVTELPVLITRDRPGNQQTAATLDVSEQSLPCTLTQRLRRRKDHKLRRAELGDVVLGNHIGSDLQFVRERANRFLLRLKLQVGKNRELCGLRGTTATEGWRGFCK